MTASLTADSETTYTGAGTKCQLRQTLIPTDVMYSYVGNITKPLRKEKPFLLRLDNIAAYNDQVSIHLGISATCAPPTPRFS